MEDKIVKPITNEPQKITPKVAMTKWMMFVAQLPKDHPDYQAQQDIQAQLVVQVILEKQVRQEVQDQLGLKAQQDQHQQYLVL